MCRSNPRVSVAMADDIDSGRPADECHISDSSPETSSELAWPFESSGI